MIERCGGQLFGQPSTYALSSGPMSAISLGQTVRAAYGGNGIPNGVDSIAAPSRRSIGSRAQSVVLEMNTEW